MLKPLPPVGVKVHPAVVGGEPPRVVALRRAELLDERGWREAAFLSSGAAYFFARGGTTWSQQAYVKASNTGGGDFFGTSIALAGDGSTLAVGADGESSGATGVGGDQASNSSSRAGATYVFHR